MGTLTFDTIRFQDNGASNRLHFMNIFYCDIPKEDFDCLGQYAIDGNSITLENEKKFNMLLIKHFNKLRSKITGNPAIYVHQNSGIPLLGNVSFGLVDRDTNIIEVKPITGCNLKCVYCSVAMDIDKRPVDFVIEADYLVDEFRKLVRLKGVKGIEAHIGGQAEPMLYSEMGSLIRGLSNIPEVEIISIDTNGTMLTEKIVDKLIDSGLTRFNLSLNAIDPEKAKEIADAPYNIEHVKRMARYIASRSDMILAPVWVPGINDEAMDDIIEFTNTIEPGEGFSFILGIQNFLPYRYGRNPVKGMPMPVFYEKLKALETQHKVKLILSSDDFNIIKAKSLTNPFRKGEVVKATVVCSGRLKGEKIAVARDRTISIPKCHRSGNIKTKIIRTKHNIIYGELMGA